MNTMISKVVDAIIELLKKHYKKPKLWLITILIFVLLVLLGPYIYSNLFYYNDMEKRIDILKQLAELDMEKINEHAEFKEEYDSLIYDMRQQRERSIYSLTEQLGRNISNIFDVEYKDSNRILKFVSGAFWLILLTICIPFMDTFNKRSDKVFAFILFLFLTVLLGILCACIPTIVTPYVNYFGIPISQIVVIVVLAVKVSNKTPKSRM